MGNAGYSRLALIGTFELDDGVVRVSDQQLSESLSAQIIVDVAKVIALEKGFAGVSTRQIAGQLGVTATALYHHFPNKAALLDALADDLVAEVAVPPRNIGWQQRLRTFVLSNQEKMLQYRGLNSHLVRRSGCSAALRWTENILAMLAEAGFDKEDLWRAFAILVFFVNPRTLAHDELIDQPHLHQVDDIDSRRYPTLAKAVEDQQSSEFDSYYEWALDGIIAGLEAELTEIQGRHGT